MKEMKKLTNLEKLDEMDNQLDQAIANCNKVIEQQNRLIVLIEGSREKEYFALFVKELKDTVENYKKQITTLNRKKELIREIKDSYKDDETTDILDKVVELFRIF